MSFSVRKINEEKGRGVFANWKIQKDDTIFEEDPFVSCQFSWNKLYKYKACDYCMKSLETAEEMCRRLANDQSILLPYPHKSPQPIDVVVCDGCQEVYCSVECRERAAKLYHHILCRANGLIDIDGLDRLDEIWRQMHYPPETATINIIIRLMAMYKQADDKEEFSRVLNGFCRNTTNESISHRLLGDQFADNLVVLRDQVARLIGDEGLHGWLNMEGFQHLFALFGQNQQGVGSSSISLWYKSLSEEEQEEPVVDQIYEKLFEEAGEFLNCEGAALYTLQSKCNHNCQPNAEIRFDHGTHRLTLKALKDIEAEEEICISYLSECELESGRHTRQKKLMENYLFCCDCGKCESQSHDPDITSEEEDSSEESDMSE